ncbi:hypothetical protein [Amantichitinum ursilacus]|uniref:Phage shock protein B n=1 Tax=Amantichitinum ursilacus TaxID=857265 RepID=A0A0N0XMJ9_9NEIS|nr:hypothetical protein [Amantichitinum ursilacus]KPC54230.1 hypothetical protein WG78_06260 [Amantichitinum ursilacus]
MSENMIFAAFFFPAAACVIIFLMRYVSAIIQTRLRTRHDEAYRELAQNAVAQQAESSGQIASLQATLSRIEARLGSVEKILKEVE